MKQILLTCSIVFFCSVTATEAEDWPMWRGDAARSAQSSQILPEDLHCRWVWELPELKPAFRSERLQFDAGYEPVVLGQTMFVASSANDSLMALDTETGIQRWRFHADGPIRFAPVADGDRVYVGSDDGHLYCLSASDGSLLWKFRAVPSGRKILGGGRLISVWPIRGGPVLHQGKIYFAAGVFPFEGVFVYALDAETGKVVWLNDDSGYLFGQHPHNAESLGGLTPQGYLVVNGNELIVPCGQALPARFDLDSGRLVSFELPAPGRQPGGWFAAADVRRGEVVLDAGINRDLHEDKIYQGPGEPDIQATIQVGERSYRFEDGFPGGQGEIHSMLAADEKLFVVTRDGELYCFGARKPGPVVRHSLKINPLGGVSADSSLANRVIEAIEDRHGYALVLGIEAGLLETLVTKTEFQIIAVDRDAVKIDRVRRKFDAAGLYGSRVSLLTAAPGEIEFPPYMADVAVVRDIEWLIDPEGAAIESSALKILRPYGGTACVNLPNKRHASLAANKWVTETFTVDRVDGMTVVQREGGLPGAANYTGGWTNPDERVRMPLGLLWFDDTLGHFKRSPQPMFFDGLMISYPKDWMAKHRGDSERPYRLMPRVLSDVYTGRVLAADELPETGRDLPTRDREEIQPNQYRPPNQTDDWKPEKPSIGTRVNPLTGREEPRVFPKSYGCDGGIDYGHLFTMRSGTAAFYDKRLESGTCYISGPRSGCTNSIIPACGLLNVPYFYEGCTCSYPLPVGLALVPKPQSFEQWAAWGPGEVTDIRRIGVNFGAPGDRMTESGTLWLDYPSRGGPSPEVQVKVEPPEAEFYYSHSLWMNGGQGWPWVAASGVKGARKVTISGLRQATFTVTLYFAEPDQSESEPRRFDIALNARTVARNFDVAQVADGPMRAVVRHFENIKVDGTLTIDLTPREGEPILSGIEIVAVGL